MVNGYNGLHSHSDRLQNLSEHVLIREYEEDLPYYTKKGKKDLMQPAKGVREYFSFQASRSLNRLSPPCLFELCTSLLKKQVNMLLAKDASTEILIFTNLIVVCYSQTSLGTQIVHSKPLLKLSVVLKLCLVCTKTCLHLNFS